MAKKKKSPISPTAVKFSVVGLIALAVGVFLFQRTMQYFSHADYFRIQAVIIDSSLSFIDKSSLSNLKGKNIFGVDLEKVRKHLSFKYPQVSDLRVVRSFPNQIRITAKPRLPVAQLHAGEKVLTLDENGIVLSSSSDKNDDLVLIKTKERSGPYTLGLPYQGDLYKIALDINKYFQSNRSLSSFQIDVIDIESTSKVDVHLKNGLLVIFDSSKIAQKVKIVGLILAQGKVDPKEAKYIDLRFKEPIVGKK